MQIIDKNKDFYDYIQFQYGIDKTRTYDRRGSVILTNSKLIDFLLDDYDKETLCENIDDNSKIYNIIRFFLECGNIQFIIGIENIKPIYCKIYY
jgi:hypothetical protein